MIQGPMTLYSRFDGRLNLKIIKTQILIDFNYTAIRVYKHLILLTN